MAKTPVKIGGRFHPHPAAENVDVDALERTLRKRVRGEVRFDSVMGFDPDKQVLQDVAAEVELPSSGCCGPAGSWGFEKEKYQISMDCGERVLLPKVREADPDSLIVADGFSCRTQIEQGTERRAIHLAQLIKAALPSGPDIPANRPEQVFEPQPTGGDGKAAKAGVAVLTATAIGAAVTATAARRGGSR